MYPDGGKSWHGGDEKQVIYFIWPNSPYLYLMRKIFANDFVIQIIQYIVYINLPSLAGLGAFCLIFLFPSDQYSDSSKFADNSWGDVDFATSEFLLT